MIGRCGHPTEGSQVSLYGFDSSDAAVVSSRDWRQVKRLSLDMSRISACWDAERFGAICECVQRCSVPSFGHSVVEEGETSVDPLEHSAHCDQSRIPKLVSNRSLLNFFWACRFRWLST